MDLIEYYPDRDKPQAPGGVQTLRAAETMFAQITCLVLGGTCYVTT